ncbi:trifunctional nucleotide phosphoesterase protein YfkN isoform X1 [Schistocerca piceifrons]|uniref:trifunctional nucleotide phosphoesterase protein YfkN isoform X1 n=1 Tax=Schistocerca piceifrons TaxID=274613 RepID=UPI001F5F061D|nr:trifunctional nucleotide phosphoesterase protein YfkN isoform X1 [Schistocerca piceifrons]
MLANKNLTVLLNFKQFSTYVYGRVYITNCQGIVGCQFASNRTLASKIKILINSALNASLEVRQAGRRTLTTLSGGAMATSPITILHYNDVYNIESRATEPVGGAARFCTAIKSFSHLNPLVLFSGDIFSPSMLSSFTKGEQMVPVLNECGTHCAVFGNHDFDFGLEVLGELVNQTTFPWLMSNVIDQETGRPLGDGRITYVVDWNGKRIGLVGLVEKEWLDTLATINPEEVTFLDFVEAGKKLGAQLKQEGCDYVIALTHMRMPNDIKLAEAVEEIDLILGGHDHIYDIRQVNGKYVVKSGTDFRQFSKITVTFDKNNIDVNVEEINVSSEYCEDAILSKALEKYSSIMEGKMDEVLGSFAVPLDGRFESVRTCETNLGNWVCDVVLAATGADLVLLNSGTFRSDMIHPAGPFTMRELVAVIPMMDPLLVLSVTGNDILRALENGVSNYPKLEGRFPQVAGLSFAFDPSKAAGQRVDPQLVRIGDEYLIPDQHYRLATKSYLYSGCDGYTMFKDAKIVVDEDECPELGLAIQNHFHAINMRLGKTKRHSKHRQSLVTLSRRHSLVKMLDGGELDGPTPLRRSTTVDVGSGEGPRHSPSPPPQPRNRLTRRASLDDLEHESCQLMPRVEGRIVILTDQKRQELLLERKRLEEDSVIPEVEDECSPQGSIDQS